MRIVLVDPRGDSRPYDHGLAVALVGRGHDVVLATSRFRHGDLPPAPGVRVQERFYRVADRLPDAVRRIARGLEHPLDLLLLLASLAVRRPAVVHVQWLPLGVVDRVAWRVARRVLGLRLVYTAHNALPKAGVGSAEQVRADCSTFPRVIVHSSVGEGSLRALGIAPSAIHRVPHGALDGYRDVAPIAPERVPASAPVVAFVGLIRPYKGLGSLLDAWPAVRAEVADAVLIVRGRVLGADGDARRASTLDAAGLGVVADFTYASAGAFAGVLARADVVVLPYRSIDQSGVLLSALAFAKPVVVTDVGALREVVDGAGAGIVVPPDDPAALAAALVRLLVDRELRDQMGSAAAAAAAGPLSWARAAELTEAVYTAGG